MFYIVYSVFCGYVVFAYSETVQNSLFEENGGVVNIYLSVFYMAPFLVFNYIMLSQKSEKKPDLKMNMKFCCGKVRSTKRSIISLLIFPTN